MRRISLRRGCSLSPPDMRLLISTFDPVIEALNAPKLIKKRCRSVDKLRRMNFDNVVLTPVDKDCQ